MEERQYESQTPMEYFQHWYQSTQQFQPQPAPQYSPVVNVLHYQQEPRQDRDTHELAVHEDQYPVQVNHFHQLTAQPTAPPSTLDKGRKRGRPPKQEAEGERGEDKCRGCCQKAKRTLDRFNGMSVEEVMAKKLPDIITYNLDILIVSIKCLMLGSTLDCSQPTKDGITQIQETIFWKCLFLSGLTDEQLNHMHDQTLPEKYSIGFTNMVERTTPGSKDLSNKEIREGGRQLMEKLQKYKPRIAAFNGKCIYEIFCKEIFGVKPKNIEFGLQPYRVPDTQTVCYLMPSSSPRCAQFPRAQDKVHFYIKLKELRDQLRGLLPNNDIQETRYIFDLAMAKEDAKRTAIKEEQHDPGYEECAGSRTQQDCSFCPANDGGAANSEHSSASENVRSNLTWTMQPFADQIPYIGLTSNDEPC